MTEELSEPVVIGIKGGLTFSQQTDHYTCVPHCLWMVLEKIKKMVPNHTIKNYTPEEIALIVKSKPRLATSFNDIQYLNEELKEQTPIVTFKPDSGYKWDDIINELKSEKPVIAYLKGNPRRRIAHAVVVTKYDKGNDQVTYIDSKSGSQTIYVADFMDYWDNAANVLYPTEVGKLIQTKFNNAIKEDQENDG